MFEAPVADDGLPGPSVAEQWVLELSTWDQRSISAKFLSDDDAHRHAVLMLSAHMQMASAVEAARSDSLELTIA